MKKPTCRAIVPPTIDCPKPATHVVTFQDGDRANVCADCAMHMKEIHGTSIKIEKL